MGKGWGKWLQVLLAAIFNPYPRLHSAMATPQTLLVCPTLQDKCEPPIYVSDRRFMKSVQLLQVSGWGEWIFSHQRACACAHPNVW